MDAALPAEDLLCPRSNCGSNCRRCGGDGRARCNPCGDLATRIAGEDFTCDACGVLVDADIAAYADCEAGRPLARTTEAGWLALNKHETKLMDCGEYVLGLRTCAFCGSTLSREVEIERKAVAL